MSSLDVLYGGRDSNGMQWQTDWLASDPVFYNERTFAVSHRINDVINPSNWEWDPEGVHNFLDFGYSVFGQTPVKHVRFMLPCQRLTVTQSGLNIEDLEDPALELLENDEACDEYAVLDAIRDSVRGWEAQQAGDIVIPTSGGFDSRLLNLMIEDRSRIRSFTYGASRRQTDSSQVIYAQKLSEILNVDWQCIRLNEIHRSMPEWYALYGISTHAHGMYQMVFYEELCKHIKQPDSLLSGIIGDAWAGMSLDEPMGPQQLSLLGYTHGMQADSSFCRLPKKTDQRDAFFERYRGLIKSPLGRIVVAMRMKLVLLSYLYRVPRMFGFKPWSPFLDPRIAISMLRISADRRRDRMWQRDYFRRESVYPESMPLRISHDNVMFEQAVCESPLGRLREQNLCSLLDEKYIRKINKVVCGTNRTILLRQKMRSYWNRQFLNWYKLRIAGAFGLGPVNNAFREAYCTYMTLWPLDILADGRSGDV